MPTASATKVTVRELKSRDLFRLMRIVRNSRATVEQIIRESRPAGEGGGFEVDKFKLGTELVFALLDQAEDEIRPWLADMAEMTPEAFDELSLADTFSVIEQIVKQEDWPAFLGRLSGLISISTTE